MLDVGFLSGEGAVGAQGEREKGGNIFAVLCLTRVLQWAYNRKTWGNAKIH